MLVPVLDLLLPARCASCRRVLNAGAGAAPVCGDCLARRPLRPAPGLPPPPGVDACYAAVAYEGSGRAVVAALKFRAERCARVWVAAVLAAQFHGQPFDAVCWVPTTGARRRRRGGDHAERLARAVAAAAGIPARRLLIRRPGPPQAGRDAAARRAGPPLAPARRAPPRVLVVDDVVTTGGSVAAAARVLRRAGAATVAVACAARTPLKVAAAPSENLRDGDRHPRP